jgi:DNA-binding beta-propeller fold protein YncE
MYNPPSIWRGAALLTLLCLGSFAAHAAPPLTAGQPVVLRGTHGRFDFLAIDAPRRRLLAAHTGNGSLDIIDLDQKTLLKSVPTGAAQGSAVDAKAGRYYASVSKPPQLTIVDAEKLEVTGKVALGGPADVMAFNAASGLAYVCHDDGKETWVIDPDHLKVAATVTLPSDAPEDLAFDSSFQRLFQNLKTASAVAVIDPKSNKVIATWPTAPAQSPHGMAMIDEAKAFAVAGGNGKLAMLSQEDGHVIASADIAERVDQIAYDAGRHLVYCASGAGKITVIRVDGNKLAALGDVKSADGAHSIAVDPKTHTVWIAYAKGEESIVQPFTPAD